MLINICLQNQELNMPLLKVAAPELIAGVSGESEARIRELFNQALTLVPCVVFLDEIDAIAPHRATAQREMERRIVAQLLSCLDGKLSISPHMLLYFVYYIIHFYVMSTLQYRY